jgi:hypothetical protein
MRRRPSRARRAAPGLLAALAVVGAQLAAMAAGPSAGAAVGAVVGAPHPVAVSRSAPDEANWILAAQLPNGAIASHTDRTFVNPYLGAYGALGLATATRISGDARYAAAAWRWAEWYGSAMDANGYVTDYTVPDSPVGTQLVSTGGYDSTDAYAGMFLVAVDATYTAAPDTARLRALAPKVALAVHAIQSTQRADGLTGAKPDWMVAYLMNEAEAYAGLRAASDLAHGLRDTTLARSADTAAAALANGVDKLWNSGTGALDWAVHPSGIHVAANWSQLYPDAMSELWAVRFGLLRGARATAVLQRFARAHPRAADPTAPDLVDGATGPGGYWPAAGLALAAVDRTAPARFLAGTRAAAAATGRAWPYSVQTAAESIELVAAGS